MKYPTWLPPALHGRLALRPQEAADARPIIAEYTRSAE